MLKSPHEPPHEPQAHSHSCYFSFSLPIPKSNFRRAFHLLKTAKDKPKQSSTVTQRSLLGGSEEPKLAQVLRYFRAQVKRPSPGPKQSSKAKGRAEEKKQELTSSSRRMTTQYSTSPRPQCLKGTILSMIKPKLACFHELTLLNLPSCHLFF